MKQLFAGKMMAVKSKIVGMKNATVNFVKEEKSARGFTEEGWMVYAAIIMGIIIVLIMTTVFDLSFNDVGNFFMDGVNGQTDQGGLNQWGDQTDGFNRE